MAGHASGIIKNEEKGTLLKRVKQSEYIQFAAILKQQLSVDSHEAMLALATFPKIHRVLAPNTVEALENLLTEYRNDTETISWVNKHKSTDYYVEMEKLGGKDTRIRDFKIGQVVNYGELRANHNKGMVAAILKVIATEIVAWKTELSHYGLSDTDALQRMRPGKVKMWRTVKWALGKNMHTLAEVEQALILDRERAGRAYCTEDRAVIDLNQIERYTMQSPTVFVGSSLIMAWHNDRRNKHRDMIKLIDLAHPLSQNETGFQGAKEGMLLGIRNLRRMLLGEAMTRRIAR